MAWSTSTRHDRLPGDWDARVKAVKNRANNQCEAAYHVEECDGRGRDVDHIRQGDDHSLTNLQLLSGPCHAAKTRLDNGYTAAVRAPVEKHPGRRG
ncbi:HNH endonuclease [Nocardioides aromaticivorans]|uniref:HNH endonuclease n=1 Tax=Nocardioides aromaticivorans TaxID=200618 RepID=A0ABX7PSA5_9ACTN|nr:HNH endonuclease [Nocardioides aromaticivorans]